MTRITRRRRALVAVSLTTLVGPALAATPAPAPAVTGPAARAGHARVLFDDFNYRSSHDQRLGRHGWTVRSRSGGPGVEGATWSPKNVSFPRVDGHQVLRLTMTTDGTAAGTTESEFSRSSAESLSGTYQARIRFTDRPSRGPDGDHLVESFFAIKEAPDCDPTYSETDFAEYLPNGGYGSSASVNSQTTWRSVGENCDKSIENDENLSLAGWHTVTGVVAGGHVRYYVDGRLVADHPRAYYPAQKMAIDFNLWLIDLDGHGTGHATSRWHEDVDYVYYAKDRVLTTRQVTEQVHKLRHHRVGFVDRV